MVHLKKRLAKSHVMVHQSFLKNAWPEACHGPPKLEKRSMQSHTFAALYPVRNSPKPTQEQNNILLDCKTFQQEPTCRDSQVKLGWRRIILPRKMKISTPAYHSQSGTTLHTIIAHTPLDDRQKKKNEKIMLTRALLCY